MLKNPLAVRSSSLLEDSTEHPFSGVFETILLPNNHEDPKIRYKQLADAIKLVFASIYSPESRSYFDAIGYKVEEEKMAIIIQEVVGSKYEGYFYPHISGTAQSFRDSLRGLARQTKPRLPYDWVCVMQKTCRRVFVPSCENAYN